MRGAKPNSSSSSSTPAAAAADGAAAHRHASRQRSANNSGSGSGDLTAAGAGDAAAAGSSSAAELEQQDEAAATGSGGSDALEQHHVGLMLLADTSLQARAESPSTAANRRQLQPAPATRRDSQQGKPKRRRVAAADGDAALTGVHPGALPPPVALQCQPQPGVGGYQRQQQEQHYQQQRTESEPHPGSQLPAHGTWLPDVRPSDAVMAAFDCLTPGREHEGGAAAAGQRQSFASRGTYPQQQQQQLARAGSQHKRAHMEPRWQPGMAPAPLDPFYHQQQQQPLRYLPPGSHMPPRPLFVPPQQAGGWGPGGYGGPAGLPPGPCQCWECRAVAMHHDPCWHAMQLPPYNSCGAAGAASSPLFGSHGADGRTGAPRPPQRGFQTPPGGAAWSGLGVDGSGSGGSGSRVQRPAPHQLPHTAFAAGVGQAWPLPGGAAFAAGGSRAGVEVLLTGPGSGHAAAMAPASAPAVASGDAGQQAIERLGSNAANNAKTNSPDETDRAAAAPVEADSGGDSRADALQARVQELEALVAQKDAALAESEAEVARLRAELAAHT